jgi:hypothetical protein
MKLHFLISVELPAAPTDERVEMVRAEIEAHAAAVVPFFTHQQPSAVACIEGEPNPAYYDR